MRQEVIELNDDEEVVVITFSETKKRISSIQWDIERLKSLEFVTALLGMALKEAEEQVRRGNVAVFEETVSKVAGVLSGRGREAVAQGVCDGGQSS